MIANAAWKLQVHSRLEANGIKANSAAYYEQLSAEVQAAYPDKWKKYLSKGCLLNTMSKQQGVINSAVTVECALSNRAAWAESQAALNSFSNLRRKTVVQSSWPRISSEPMSLEDEVAAPHITVQQGSGPEPACLGTISPMNSDVQGRSAGKPLLLSFNTYWRMCAQLVIE